MRIFKRSVVALLVIALIFVFPIQSFAMENTNATDVAVLSLKNGEPAIMPRWSYTGSVTLDLSFSGSTAVCELIVIGSSTSSGIKANLWLYQQNDNGSWTVLNSWKNITTEESSMLVTRYYNPAYYGETYKLYFTGKCFGPNGVYYDALAAETIVTR